MHARRRVGRVRESHHDGKMSWWDSQNRLTLQAYLD